MERRVRPTNVRYTVMIPYKDGLSISETGVEFELTQAVRDISGLVHSTAHIPRKGDPVRLRNLNNELVGYVHEVVTCEYGTFQTVEVCLKPRSIPDLRAWMRSRGWSEGADNVADAWPELKEA